MDSVRWLDERAPLVKVSPGGAISLGDFLVPIVFIALFGLLLLAIRRDWLKTFWRSEQTPAVLLTVLVADAGFITNWLTTHAPLSLTWAVAVLLFGAVTIATAEQRASKVDATLAFIETGIATLMARQASSDETLTKIISERPEPKPKDEDLQLSDQRLAEEAISWAKHMRDFEAGYFAKRYEAMFTTFLPRDASQEERQKRWDEMNENSIKLSREKDLDFGNRFLGRAIQLRDDMLTRLLKRDREKANELHEEGRVLIAFRGMLAGPTPVSDAANYLEKLARTLCPSVQ